jgi:hypothetical protein
VGEIDPENIARVTEKLNIEINWVYPFTKPIY